MFLIEIDFCKNFTFTFLNRQVNKLPPATTFKRCVDQLTLCTYHRMTTYHDGCGFVYLKIQIKKFNLVFELKKPFCYFMNYI